MATLIYFAKQRLHVGYRARDFREVFFEPTRPNGVPDDSGDGDSKKIQKWKDCFYMSEKAGVAWENPRRGEICWLPFYDPALCEAKEYGAKMDIQWEAINKAYDYLAETDADRCEAIYEDIGNRGWARWNVWLEQAEKWKRSQLRVRDRRRKKREMQGRAIGLTREEAAKQAGSDTSDDSGFSEDDMSVRPSGPGGMGPPPPPAAARKRNAQHRGGRGNGVGPMGKKVKTGMVSNDGIENESSYMSGVRGSSHDLFRDIPDDPLDPNNDGLNHIFDTRPPSSPSVVNGFDGDNTTRVGSNRSRSCLTHGSMNGNEANDDEEDNGLFVRDDRQRQNGNEQRRDVREFNAGLNDDEAFNLAIRQSMPPENRQRNGVVPSIEGDDRMESGGNEDGRNEADETDRGGTRQAYIEDDDEDMQT